MTDLKKRLEAGDYKVEIWSLDRIARYTNNPRKNDDGVAKVAASIKKFGWRQPIVVDRNGIIVVGDTRYMAARLLALAGAPVHVADDLTDDEARAYRLADNRTHDESAWDTAKVVQELDALRESDMSLLAETGFDPEEIEKFLGEDDAAATLEPMDIREPPKMTWVLVGIPTTRYMEIAADVEKLSAIPEVFCEVSAADSK